MAISNEFYGLIVGRWQKQMCVDIEAYFALRSSSRSVIVSRRLDNLSKVLYTETAESSSLQYLQSMHPKDGSPLSLSHYVPHIQSSISSN
ncbi:hypothetical protein ACTXT7_011680 [Hymenolepis weldensis]